MNKIICVFSIFISFFLFSADKFNFIPNASYFVFQNATGPRGDEIIGNSLVELYTFDGKFICNMPHIVKLIMDNGKKKYIRVYPYQYIDPKAAKPQPVRCDLVMWPEIDKSCENSNNVSDQFIAFYDKFDNIITSFRYQGSNLDIESISNQLTYKKKENSDFYYKIGELIDLSKINIP